MDKLIEFIFQAIGAPYAAAISVSVALVGYSIFSFGIQNYKNEDAIDRIFGWFLLGLGIFLMVWSLWVFLWNILPWAWHLFQCQISPSAC